MAKQVPVITYCSAIMHMLVTALAHRSNSSYNPLSEHAFLQHLHNYHPTGLQTQQPRGGQAASSFARASLEYFHCKCLRRLLACTASLHA